MADILIKGVEMPKEGRLVLAICPDGAVYKYFGDQNKYGGYRIDSAQKYLAKSPAIELPPHGRLIDADRLEERSYLIKGVDGRIRTVIELCDIDDATTIVEATE